MRTQSFAFAILLATSFLLVSCSPQQPPAPAEVTRLVEQTQEVTRQVQVTTEVTRVVEVPVTVTHTPGPSPTPTETSTPTITPTLTPSPSLTPSPTPFRTAGCQNLRSLTNYWNIDKSDYPDRVYPTYDALDDECVRFYASEELGVIATDLGWISLMDLDFTFVIDEITPEDYKRSTYSTIWGIWHVIDDGEYEIDIRRAEPFPNLQQPIEDDGFYLVGQEGDIASGRIKSLWPPGQIDSCYWARTNPDTGDIKANHFGQAGVYATLYNGDLFETDDCAPWVYAQ